MILPTSYTLPSDILNIGPTRSPQDITVMCIREPSTVQWSASNAYGFTLRIRKRLSRCVTDAVTSPHHQRDSQGFCREAVIWKRLAHPNIIPLLGVTLTPPQLISNWMSDGHLSGYIKRNPDADRLGLVGISTIASAHTHSVASYPTWPRASITSTPATLSMVTSRGYVAALNLVLPRH
jgi:hypothetical protein